MKKKRKSGSGGRRTGAGRKLKYFEKTIPVSFAVPVSKKQEIKQKIEELLPAMIRTASPDAQN
jgi:hypothetical protein